MQSLPNILPPVKFPNFGIVSCFSCFSWFLGEKKKRKIWKKKLLDKNGPKNDKRKIRNPGESLLY